MGLVPLAEGGSIDLDDSALDKRVRPDELVVGSVVDLEKIVRDGPFDEGRRLKHNETVTR